MDGTEAVVKAFISAINNRNEGEAMTETRTYIITIEKQSPKYHGSKYRLSVSKVPGEYAYTRTLWGAHRRARKMRDFMIDGGSKNVKVEIHEL